MMIYYFHEGWNWNGKEGTDSELKFDAPLDKDMNPRPAFGLLKQFGASLEAGLGTSPVTRRETSHRFSSLTIRRGSIPFPPYPTL